MISVTWRKWSFQRRIIRKDGVGDHPELACGRQKPRRRSDEATPKGGIGGPAHVERGVHDDSVKAPVCAEGCRIGPMKSARGSVTFSRAQSSARASASSSRVTSRRCGAGRRYRDSPTRRPSQPCGRAVCAGSPAARAADRGRSRLRKRRRRPPEAIVGQGGAGGLPVGNREPGANQKRRPCAFVRSVTCGHGPDVAPEAVDTIGASTIHNDDGAQEAAHGDERAGKRLGPWDGDDCERGRLPRLSQSHTPPVSRRRNRVSTSLRCGHGRAAGQRGPCRQGGGARTAMGPSGTGSKPSLTAVERRDCAICVCGSRPTARDLFFLHCALQRVLGRWAKSMTRATFVSAISYEKTPRLRRCPSCGRSASVSKACAWVMPKIVRAHARRNPWACSHR